jgi:hypothetical protein
MSCKCQDPKRMKNSAGGVDFYVCARSKGGCGEEIDPRITFVGSWSHGVDYAKPKSDKTVEVTFSGTVVNFNINPHKPKVIECPHCYGGGMVAKLYPNGHTEVSCEYCDGVGEVEL